MRYFMETLHNICRPEQYLVFFPFVLFQATEQKTPRLNWLHVFVLSIALDKDLLHEVTITLVIQEIHRSVSRIVECFCWKAVAFWKP